MPKKTKFKFNAINQGDGLDLLRSLPADYVNLVFFDPQYEPASQVSRTKDWPLACQTPRQISQFLKEITRVLNPSGFCLRWINKALLVTGQVLAWLLPIANLKIVDLLILVKPHFGFGSYFRNQVEFAFLAQKQPTNSKLFKNRSFGNVWTENSLPASQRKHPHQKPKGLIRDFIEDTTEKGDLIVDPCAGSFIVLEVCQETKREFIGCDLTYQAMEGFMNKTKQTKRVFEKVCLN